MKLAKGYILIGYNYSLIRVISIISDYVLEVMMIVYV